MRVAAWLLHAGSIAVTLAGSTTAQPAALALSGDFEVTSTNLVDVLSQDPELSLFIRLLQRARLIPTLNKIHDATVFAPTNEAVRNRSLADPVLAAALLKLKESAEQEELDGRDNLQYRLRERLFYHMLNYTSPDLSFPDVLDSHIAYESTLLFPTTHEEHGRPGHVPYPAPEDTLLGGEGQKLSLLREPQKESGDDVVIRVGVEGGGGGGAAVIPGRGGRGRNGRVVVIDDLLHPPKSIAHQIRKRAGAGAGAGDNDTQPGTLSRFASLLSDEMWKKYTEDSHTTLFVPHDKAFDALHPLEWKYLRSGFAADDILQIAKGHQAEYTGDVAHREKVGYLDRLLEVKTSELDCILYGALWSLLTSPLGQSRCSPAALLPFLEPKTAKSPSMACPTSSLATFWPATASYTSSAPSCCRMARSRSPRRNTYWP